MDQMHQYICILGHHTDFGMRKGLALRGLKFILLFFVYSLGVEAYASGFWGLFYFAILFFEATVNSSFGISFVKSLFVSFFTTMGNSQISTQTSVRFN